MSEARKLSTVAMVREACETAVIAAWDKLVEAEADDLFPEKTFGELMDSATLESKRLNPKR